MLLRTFRPRTRSLGVLVVGAALASCRSSGDFRVLYEPDPVPRCARTGKAWFRARVDSLSRQPARIGREGTLLPAGASAWIEVEVAADESSFALELWTPDASSRLARVETRVRTVQAKLDDERELPMPRLGGGQARVVAGYHARNHMQAGRRRALDLVPDSGPALDAAIESPVEGRVLGVTTEMPDIPGGRPNEILIRAKDGRILLFSHLRRGSCPWKPGETVRVGDLLGRIGLSGRTSGPHLHLELVESRSSRR